jgi:sugar/nucleoside kinase (ribokinase family)
VLHLSGYSLFRSPIDLAGAKAMGAVRAQGGRISVDLSSAEGIVAFGAERLRERLGQLQPDFIFGNEAEWDAAGGALPFSTARVIKRGSRGFFLHEPLEDRPQSFAPVPAEVLDSTGAGDALAAGFLVGGPELGLDAAARCVAKLGAMP